MKNLQQFCAVVVLTLVFTISAPAGEIPGPGGTTPPPQVQICVTGDIDCPGTTDTGEIQFPGAGTLNPITEAMLSLFQSILSLF